MKRLLILLIPVLALAQIHAKVETNNYKTIIISSQSKIVSINKQEKNKVEEKLTILDGIKFTELVKDRPVDIEKSKDVGYTNQANDLIEIAKKNKIIIEVVNDKGHIIKYDLSKEDERSVFYNLKAALKSGYKKSDK
jgi:hypothetical protein